MTTNRRPSLVSSVMTSEAGLIVGLFCLVLGVSLWPRPVRACSIALPPPALEGIPADGDVAVPTDVRLIYDLFAAHLTALAVQSPEFELTDASGQILRLVQRPPSVGKLELVPENQLQPLTVYRLRGHWREASPSAGETTLSLSFTTAAGPAVAPSPPVASMQHYAFREVALSSCDPQSTGTCVSIPASTTVAVTYIDSFGQEVADFSPDGLEVVGYLRGGPFFDNLSGLDQGTNFECVKLRTRALNGSLSEPVVLCGKDAPTFELRGTANIACSPAGLTHDGHLVSQTSRPINPATLTGCAFFGGVTATSPPSLSLLALAVILRRRRRRAVDEDSAPASTSEEKRQ
jgi:hypothetical protein